MVEKSPSIKLIRCRHRIEINKEINGKKYEMKICLRTFGAVTKRLHIVVHCKHSLATPPLPIGQFERPTSCEPSNAEIKTHFISRVR